MAGIDILGRLDADAALLRLRLRLEVLTRQVSTGQRAAAPGDLAPQLPRALSLQHEVGRRDTQATAIGEAQGRTAVTQSVLKRLGEIARDFGDGVALKLDPMSPGAIPMAANRARAALIEVGQLLNSKQDGEYLFGGSDFSNPPVPNPDGLPTSGFAVQIATAVATLGPGNAATVAAATGAAATSNTAGVTPFSAFLSNPATGLAEPRRSVPAEDGVLAAYGIAANRNAAATSSGATTGSWARDLMRGLASIAALTPAQAASPADFLAFAGTIRDGVQSAGRALADEAGALGITEARLDGARTRHADVTVTLRAQLGSILEVDLADVLTRLQATKTTLEASYSVLGRLGGLTLTQFLR